MTYVNILPFMDGARFIVVDEGVDSMYAEALITGWLQEFKTKKPNADIKLLLFSEPMCTYKRHFANIGLHNVKIQDYYSLTINEEQDNIFNKLPSILKENSEKSSIVIVDCLSSLVLLVGIAKASWFIEKLGANVEQLICIYRRDFGLQNIPRADTLGTSYVKLEHYSGISLKNNFIYTASVIHRKQGGTILHQTETITQDLGNYTIKADKKINSINNKRNNASETSEKVQTSFRIEVSEREREQRNNVNLPYTITSNSTSSKIIYQPDELDDFDEDDPDDDLCI